MVLRNYILTETQQIFINENYQSISGRELSRKLSVSLDHVRAYLRFNNLKRTSRRNKHRLNDFYFHDETKFTSTTWFIIGFLIGDGNIATPAGKCKTPQKLNISLHTKDIEILELLKSELSATCPVTSRTRYDKRTNKNYYISEFYCNSIQLVDDLRKFGIVPRKSGKEFLPKIPDDFFYDFIAGIFSADGCIHKHKNTTIYSFDICGCNKQFLSDIQSRVGGKIRQQNHIYRLSLNMKELLDITPKLLKNHNLLSRKRAILIEFLNARKGIINV